MTSRIAAILLAVTALLAQPASAGKRAITPADIVEAEVVTGPQLSTSGKWLAYSVSQNSLEKNQRDQAVYLVAVAGGKPERMVGPEAQAYAPAFLPGGEILSFIAKGKEGRPQIFTYDPVSKSLQQVTNFSRSISGYRWSPGGDQLALILRDEKTTDPRFEGMQEPWIIDRQQFKADGVGYLDRRRSHIYLLDLKSNELTQLTHGDYDNGSPVWSPDGSRLAFTSNRTDNPDGNGDIDVWIMSVAEGDKNLTLVSRSDDMDWSPKWSPDGRYLAYTTYEDPRQFYFSLRKLEVYDTISGRHRQVAKEWDRSFHNAKFSPDSKHLYFVLENEGQFNLARVAASGKGKLEMVTEGNNSISSYAMGGKTLITRNGDYQSPGDYARSGNLYVLENNQFRQLSFHNEDRYADIELVDGEVIWYPTRDGQKVQAWVYKPADFDSDKKYPLIIDVHGGSVMQIGYRFEGDAQLFAANGYVVMKPNYRGSSGYGRKFQTANWPKLYGGPDYQDVADGARYMAFLPYIDADRMAVQGWSYGGGITNKLITKEPELFAAAISGAGVSLRYGEYGTDIYQAAIEKVLGLPWENRESWIKDGAFHDIANAKTPTMFVHGEKDWNVPVTNAERMYQGMKRLGRETLLLIYPNQPHVLMVPRYEEHRLEMYLKWYAKHL